MIHSPLHHRSPYCPVDQRCSFLAWVPWNSLAKFAKSKNVCQMAGFLPSCQLFWQPQLLFLIGSNIIPSFSSNTMDDIESLEAVELHPWGKDWMVEWLRWVPWSVYLFVHQEAELRSTVVLCLLYITKTTANDYTCLPRNGTKIWHPQKCQIQVWQRAKKCQIFASLAPFITARFDWLRRGAFPFSVLRRCVVFWCLRDKNTLLCRSWARAYGVLCFLEVHFIVKSGSFLLYYGYVEEVL